MKAKERAQDLLLQLPKTRGRIRANADLSKSNWFQVGGETEILFRPEDNDDLAYFLVRKPEHVPITILGAGSNLLVRDGGIEGVVIRLGRGFAECRVDGDRVIAGAACLNSSVTALAQQYGIGGLEFLSGIPGSIGGALFMNAGAYGTETKDILIEAHAIDSQGNMHVLTPDQFNYSYRHSRLPDGWILTAAILQGKCEGALKVTATMEAIANARASTQPIRSRTGGSTFKNPPHVKAWQLIDAAGCRGLQVGNAQMSTLHCNFMINIGGATAEDLETLGEEVRTRVYNHCGVMLEWEIKRIGKALSFENSIMDNRMLRQA